MTVKFRDAVFALHVEGSQPDGGAAQESNLPSVGLQRRTGFEGLSGEVQSAMGGAPWRRLRTPGSSQVP